MNAKRMHPSNTRAWKPSAGLKASAALHVGAAAAALAPGVWPYSLGVLALNHALLTGAGLWPRSRLLGPNLTRLPPSAANQQLIALTIDDGPDPIVTPKVLELLAAHKVKASFFCIGSKAMQHRELVQEIVRQGHTVENHTQHHTHHFSFMGMKAFEREIGAAQDHLSAITGRAPRFFRAPAGLRNPLLDPVLHKLNLQLATWTRRGYDTRSSDERAVKARLLKNLSAGDILLVHDGNAQITGANQAIILAVLPDLINKTVTKKLILTSLDHAVPHSASLY
jgi:peptidoglycan-N-acetylglucosamine deacetylase